MNQRVDPSERLQRFTDHGLNSHGIRDVCRKTEGPAAFVSNQLSGLLQRLESACDKHDIRAGTGGLHGNGTSHPRTCAGNQHDPVRKVHYGLPSFPQDQ